MKKKTFVDEYMNEIIDYGGEDYTRADVIRDMQRMGQSQADIDRWSKGYELGKELAEKRRATKQAQKPDSRPTKSLISTISRPRLYSHPFPSTINQVANLTVCRRTGFTLSRERPGLHKPRRRRSNRPGNSQAKRTATRCIDFWREAPRLFGARVSADGIAISGKQTEGAHLGG